MSIHFAAKNEEKFECIRIKEELGDNAFIRCNQPEKYSIPGEII
jgi:hypothetical protein